MTPIALFAYRRPEHLKKVIKSIQSNPEAQKTDLYIFCDAPKSDNASADVQNVRRIAHSVSGFNNLHVIERDTNLGLSNSIINGVTHVLQRYETVTVVEDDLIVAPTFLRYINENIELYRETHEVISIHGYCYPTATKLPSRFFIRGADCWGWATWRRGWELFNPNGEALLNQLNDSNQTALFDFDNSFPYTQMLTDQIEGKNDSWAIRWYASAFLKEKLTLYPGESLVRNIGFDNSGTHCSSSNLFDVPLGNYKECKTAIPLIESAQARIAFRDYFQKLNRPKKTKRNIISSIASILQQLRQTIFFERR